MHKRFSGVVFLLLILLTADAFSQEKGKIIGGNPAPAGAYPWMTALVSKNKSIFQGQFCGGMLVAPRWVLTAAHCMEGENKNTFDVWVGMHDLNNPAGAQKRNVVAVYKHPNFRADRYDNLFYDAALILLDQPVTTITPVGMASQSSHNDVGAIVRALGWGVLDPIFNVFPDILEEVDLQIADIADAQADYQNVLGATHLAAAVPAFNKDTCSGDSGGPLFRINGGNHILVGITSFGDGCAVDGVEGIYANVLFLRPWIDAWLALTMHPPAMGLNYRSRSITSADRFPSRADGTHFGGSKAGRREKKKSYRLRNDGAGLLTVLNSRISSRAFKLIKGPSTVVFPGGIPKVQIAFSPRRKGRFTGTVRILSNDPDDPLFWFRVRGKGR